MPYQVKIYKPRKSDGAITLRKTIPSKKLALNCEAEVFNICKSPHERQLNTWRRMEDKPLVKCIQCGKETKNLSSRAKKYCSEKCGEKFRRKKAHD
jgi:hypothetical protein